MYQHLHMYATGRTASKKVYQLLVIFLLIWTDTTSYYSSVMLILQITIRFANFEQGLSLPQNLLSGVLRVYTIV
jgi:hypothetical protein